MDIYIGDKQKKEHFKELEYEAKNYSDEAGIEISEQIKKSKLLFLNISISAFSQVL